MSQTISGHLFRHALDTLLWPKIQLIKKKHPYSFIYVCHQVYECNELQAACL